MFCSNCGDPIEQNENYCNKCGNYLGTNPVNSNLSNVNNTINNQVSPRNYTVKTTNNKSNNKKMIFIGLGIGSGILFILIVSLLVFNSFNNYYFSDNSFEDKDEQIQTNNNTSTQRKSKYSTVIITDNTYSGVSISNIKEANELISKDSVNQKNNCPNDIKLIENEIISKYDITAVNLCEMDAGFAKEVSSVFKKIYDEYPSIRGYLTNLTLINASMSEGYIAAFMPIFNFATSDSSSTYPWVIKTQVLLNTSYFLNTDRLKASVEDGSKSGHFPPNATMYSPVAHELGHYLSFLAMMKNYELNSILLVDNKNINSLYSVYNDFADGKFSLLMIREAYEKCKKDTNITLSIDEWRATISNYAVAKDNSGNYIYDETIAEAFHDVYLNGNKAKLASKYVVDILKDKLEGK